MFGWRSFCRSLISRLKSLQSAGLSTLAGQRRFTATRCVSAAAASEPLALEAEECERSDRSEARELSAASSAARSALLGGASSIRHTSPNWPLPSLRTSVRRDQRIWRRRSSASEEMSAKSSDMVPGATFTSRTNMLAAVVLLMSDSSGLEVKEETSIIRVRTVSVRGSGGPSPSLSRAGVLLLRASGAESESSLGGGVAGAAREPSDEEDAEGPDATADFFLRRGMPLLLSFVVVCCCC